MLQQFSSMDAARHAFDEYAALEPELTELWALCRDAAPPSHDADAADVADAFDVDLYDIDDLAVTASDDGWCAEDFFGQQVKSRLMLLVGWYRTSGPDELRSAKAYDTVYAALFDWALDRHCTCCADDGADHGADDGADHGADDGADDSADRADGGVDLGEHGAVHPAVHGADHGANHGASADDTDDSASADDSALRPVLDDHHERT